MLEEIQRKQEEKAKKGGSNSPLKEQRAAIEASRLEIREKVQIKLRKVIIEEE